MGTPEMYLYGLSIKTLKSLLLFLKKILLLFQGVILLACMYKDIPCHVSKAMIIPFGRITWHNHGAFANFR